MHIQLSKVLWTHLRLRQASHTTVGLSRRRFGGGRGLSGPAEASWMDDMFSTMLRQSGWYLEDFWAVFALARPLAPRNLLKEMGRSSIPASFLSAH